MRQNLRIFLLHASEDKNHVRQLDQRLIADGFESWLDERSLLPGQSWELETTNAINASDLVFICLSQNAVNKKGYIQKEIRYALDVAKEQPEGVTFIIPVMLEECIIPVSLQHLHCARLFEKEGYQRLIKALQSRASELGFSIPRKRELLSFDDSFKESSEKLAVLVQGVVDNLEQIMTGFPDSVPDSMKIERFISDFRESLVYPDNSEMEVGLV